MKGSAPHRSLYSGLLAVTAVFCWFINCCAGQATCADAPSGLVSWWRAETNALDQIGGNNGTFTNAEYLPGEVGAAFNFNGSGNNVVIPGSSSLDVGTGQGFTLEAWINPADLSTGRPILEWALPNTYGTHFWINVPSAGYLYGNLVDTNGTLHKVQTATAVITAGTYQHVALSYDRASGIARLYVNGIEVQSATIGSYTLRTSPNLFIGYRPSTSPFGPVAFLGMIDEPSVYNRALAAAEILLIYNAGSAGKCLASTPTPPFIVIQPTNQVVVLTSNAVFSVQAGGTSPLFYQWMLNGAPITGATNNSMILTNVQFSNAGRYSVLLTNSYGSVMSSNAVLIVKYPPAQVRLPATAVPGGTVLTLPVEIVANGNENAMAFTVNFDTTKLSFLNASLGNSVPDGLLAPNTSLLGSGKVGISLALPPSSALLPGTQQVAQISFLTSPVISSTTTTISFGDKPTPRQLWDVNLTSLDANYSNGPVLLGVRFAPARIMLLTNSVSSGGTFSMPVLLVANGNENALNFSLNFDTTKLTYAGVTIGAGAPNGNLIASTGLLGTGRIGFSLAVPPGQTFLPGTQEVARITFVASVVNTPVLTPVNFGDQPTARQLWDPQSTLLAATYSNTAIYIGATGGLEGDVFPATDGDSIISLSDWLQMGRYVAGMDSPLSAEEFQRADCAPRTLSGDGALTVADWVQTGRYAAGLDALSANGGPLAPARWYGMPPSTNRVLTGEIGPLSPGQVCSVNVSLKAQGNENAIGFSLLFDPAEATFARAIIGPDAMNAAVYVNTNQVASGRLGIALALSPGQTFGAGTLQLLTLDFQAGPSALGRLTPNFGDAPVPRDIADPLGNSLAASYFSGTNANNFPAVLEITRSGSNVILSWPFWATNMNLQQTFSLTSPWNNVLGPITVTNTANQLLQPLSQNSIFYRLSPLN